MVASAKYVPILKGKEGEFAALQELFANEQNGILPLIEIPSVPRDYAAGGFAKELDAHVAPIAGRLLKCWGRKEIYLDLSRIGVNEDLKDGRIALVQVLDDCAKMGVVAVPGLSLASSSKYLTAASRYSDSTGTGVCLRLGIKDFQEDVDLEAEAQRIFAVLRSNGKSDVDLIIDLEDLDPTRSTLIARSVFSMIPRKDEWRRMVLAASSFPEDLSDVFAAATSRLPRHEWELWRTLQRKPNLLPRRDLIYGDYSISHPVTKELDPRTMRMSASIRYTTKDGWLIIKGRNVRQYGFDQYFGLCKQLVTMEEYSGRGFSWGDKFIDDCSEKMAGPGNATTWRKVGVNHHLTLVARELAKLASGS